MVESARALNPEIEILIRTHSEEEARILEQEKAGKIFLDKQERAFNMTRYALSIADAILALNIDLFREPTPL